MFLFSLGFRRCSNDVKKWTPKTFYLSLLGFDIQSNVEINVKRHVRDTPGNNKGEVRGRNNFLKVDPFITG